jgi:hypothetical protein
MINGSLFSRSCFLFKKNLSLLVLWLKW